MPRPAWISEFGCEFEQLQSDRRRRRPEEWITWTIYILNIAQSLAHDEFALCVNPQTSNSHSNTVFPNVRSENITIRSAYAEVARHASYRMLPKCKNKRFPYPIVLFPAEFRITGYEEPGRLWHADSLSWLVPIFSFYCTMWSQSTDVTDWQTDGRHACSIGAILYRTKTTFLPRYAMLARVLAVVMCLFLCVCLSHAGMHRNCRTRVVHGLGWPMGWAVLGWVHSSKSAKNLKGHG